MVIRSFSSKRLDNEMTPPIEIPGTSIAIPAEILKKKCLECGKYYAEPKIKNEKWYCPWCNCKLPDLKTASPEGSLHQQKAIDVSSKEEDKNKETGKKS